MFDFFNRRKIVDLSTLENVESWEPSRRPKYQNISTKTIYTLDKMEKGKYVVLRKSCGKTIIVNLAEFTTRYKRV